MLLSEARKHFGPSVDPSQSRRLFYCSESESVLDDWAPLRQIDFAISLKLFPTRVPAFCRMRKHGLRLIPKADGHSVGRIHKTNSDRQIDQLLLAKYPRSCRARTGFERWRSTLDLRECCLISFLTVSCVRESWRLGRPGERTQRPARGPASPRTESGSDTTRR